MDRHWNILLQPQLLILMFSQILVFCYLCSSVVGLNITCFCQISTIFVNESPLSDQFCWNRKFSELTLLFPCHYKGKNEVAKNEYQVNVLFLFAVMCHAAKLLGD